jgi:hypothetical protein
VTGRKGESITDDQILDTFVGLFNWLYQIEIPPAYRQQIEQHVRAGWFNNDPSEHTLLKFVLEISGRLNQTSYPDLHRPSIQQHFANEFAALTTVSPNLLNDKYRILAIIHSMVESLRPGATGLPLSARGMATTGLQSQEEQDRQRLLETARMRHEMLRSMVEKLSQQ